MNEVGLPRIVIMDDDPDVVDRMVQLLEDDYQVEATDDWARLNHLVFVAGCDLVLMDVNLPVLSGDKLVSVLTNAPADRRPQIVFFSSEDTDRLQQLILETGADGYISKSMRSAELPAATR